MGPSIRIRPRRGTASVALSASERSKRATKGRENFPFHDPGPVIVAEVYKFAHAAKRTYARRHAESKTDVRKNRKSDYHVKEENVCRKIHYDDAHAHSHPYTKNPFVERVTNCSLASSRVVLRRLEIGKYAEHSLKSAVLGCHANFVDVDL
ncbi:hypothetical protein MTO96_018108 [Rhipicephalus appendiculatus]